VYAQEYGYDTQFEALVAEIVAQFVQRFDPKRERCWIAEQGGEVVARCSWSSDPRPWRSSAALVEPKARGRARDPPGERVRALRAPDGLPQARALDQSELRAARRLYEAAGFSIVRKEKNHSFGRI